MRFDLNIFKMLPYNPGLSADFKKFDNKKCHFFYDETNNIRKLWLKEERFYFRWRNVFWRS